MNQTKKAINFDLDTNELGKIFPEYTTGYGKLKKSFIECGFEHRQGSGYVSILPMSYFTLKRVVKKIASANVWLEKCTKKFDVTEVGETFDLSSQLKKHCARISSAKQTPAQNSPTQKAVQRDDEELERD